MTKSLQERLVETADKYFSQHEQQACQFADATSKLLQTLMKELTMQEIEESREVSWQELATRCDPQEFEVIINELMDASNRFEHYHSS